MITSTVRTDTILHNPRGGKCPWRLAALLILSTLALPPCLQATVVLSSWNPIFKGIEHAVGTNNAAGLDHTSINVINAMRVDLSDPDLQFYTTPRYSSYVAEYDETAGYTVTNFLRIHSLQVAINANNFHDPGTSDSPSYTITEGSPFDVGGVMISKGIVVSSQESATDSAAILFTTNNVPTFVPTNWPAHSTTGFYTAVSGLYPVLVNNVNVGSNYISSGWPHDNEPRTAMGLSSDRRYLYLLVIDGRQSGYSDGAYDYETAAWLQLLGATDGVNLDGGGSTCMVMMDSTGHPAVLNRDSASPSYGRERTVGTHFGIYAKPVPSFFTNIAVQAEDKTATITWNTLQPATTQVKYGPTTNFNLATPIAPTLTTNHTVLLTNLTPFTDYYYQLVCSNSSSQYTSSNFLFTTTNYVTTNSVFDFTNVWSYTVDNLDGVSWTVPAYDDSGWTGSGPGLLWVDTRGSVNSSIPVTPITEMPSNPSSGYPYPTYYFRTHFSFTNAPSGVTLLFEDYIDDGAVFYLNGTEVGRLRMAASPTLIYNATLATAYPCTGDATCPDDFSLSGAIVETNLVTGDNVIAVEVHNYNAASPDITFGLSLTATVPYAAAPTSLSFGMAGGVLTLNWSGTGFTLQQADSPAGTWSDVPGPVLAGPYVVTNTGTARFFRLRK